MFFFVLLCCAACDSNDPGEEIDPNSVAGTWVGSVKSTVLVDENRVDSVEFPIEIEVMESMTILSGSGTVDQGDETISFEIEPTSSYIHPRVNMFLFFERPPLGTLNGTVASDRMSIRGSMAGPGFSGVAEFEIRKMQ